MKIHPGATVVDFGCGYGEYTIAIALSMGNKGMVIAIEKGCGFMIIVESIVFRVVKE